MASTPDRWTRLVEKQAQWPNDHYRPYLHPREAEQLMRREHAATVRAVQRMKRSQLAHKQAGSVMSDRQCYYCQALDDLLAWLEQRRK